MCCVWEFHIVNIVQILLLLILLDLLGTVNLGPIISTFYVEELSVHSNPPLISVLYYLKNMIGFIQILLKLLCNLLEVWGFW